MKVRQTKQFTITSYNGDPRISGVYAVMKRKKTRFSMKKPLTAAAIIGVAALAIGLVTLAVGESKKESLRMCVHKAMQEKEHLNNEWKRRLSQNVVHGDGQYESEHALTALIVEKEQMERKFRATLQECVEKK